MKTLVRAALSLTTLVLLGGHAAAQVPGNLGTEEFGLTPKQLVEAIGKTENLIAKCMREQGFEYIAADYGTVRRGMVADKSMPGLSEEEFVARYGFGISTLYTGEAPQLAKGYSPGREGLGERNIQIYKRLAPADQVAYNRALLGENINATFAVSLEQENFTWTGGCTRKAIAQVFKPEDMAANYYNPKDSLINQDPLMKEALRQYSAEMRKAGFDYAHPDEVETDVRKRLDALTKSGLIRPDQMTPAQTAALKELQAYERKVAAKHHQLHVRLIEPVADKIEAKMFARKPQ